MTHSEFIAELGGGTEIAKRLSIITGTEVDREAVYKWRENNHVPWRWRHYLVAIAKKKRVKPPDGFLPSIRA